MRPTPLLRRLPRPLLALRRNPRLWWGLVTAAALTAGWAAAEAATRAESARAAWGATELVVVARSDLAAGDAITADDVALEARPPATIPRGALRALPREATAGAAIVAGEVVVDARLAPPGVSGLAATLPRGTRAVAIPAEPGVTPPLRTGDRVDVIVAVATDAAGDGPPGFVLVPAALVVALDERAVTVAVPRDDAPRVAVALGAGSVSLALVGA